MDFHLTRSSKVFVKDGGFGVEIQRRGFSVENEPLWSAAALIDNPRLVVDTHKSFVTAGCDVILTNTYHANIPNLMRYRNFTRSQANQLITDSIKLANKAIEESGASDQIYVVGSVGPYATTFFNASEYSGQYVENTSEEVLVDYFINQCRPLLEGGLRTLAFETIPAKLEALAILKAVQSIPERFNCWVSFSCKNRSAVCYGDAFAECIEKVTAADAVFAGGVNCTSAKLVKSLLHSAQNVCHDKPFVLYPTFGAYKDGRWISDPVDYKSLVPIWINQGARLIGGCCQVKPDDIRSLVSVVHAIK